MLQDLSAVFATLPGGELVWTVLMFIVVLSVLVFVHEWGHYAAARSVGVHAEVFSIGFGKEIFGWYDKRGTRWKVSWVPLGGYVKMKGDTKEAEAELDPQEREHSFLHKGVLQRMWVVLAGPLANFVFAAVVFAGMMMHGEQKLKPVVSEVVSESAAAAAGLQVGDVIMQINDKVIGDFHEMAEIISQNGGNTLSMTIKRNDEQLTLPVTPKVMSSQNVLGETKQVGVLGVRAGISPETTFTVQHGVIDAMVLGVEKTVHYTAVTLKAIWRMITGAMPAEVGGPLTIAKMAGDSSSQGWYPLLLFMAVISINLGLINLFPIPMLDGGHLVFFAVEGIKGSPISEKTQDVGYRIGFAMVIMLMCFAFYKDIMRIVMPAVGDMMGVKVE